MGPDFTLIKFDFFLVNVVPYLPSDLRQLIQSFYRCLILTHSPGLFVLSQYESSVIWYFLIWIHIINRKKKEKSSFSCSRLLVFYFIVFFVISSFAFSWRNLLQNLLWQRIWPKGIWIWGRCWHFEYGCRLRRLREKYSTSRRNCN